MSGPILASLTLFVAAYLYTENRSRINEDRAQQKRITKVERPSGEEIRKRIEIGLQLCLADPSCLGRFKDVQIVNQDAINRRILRQIRREFQRSAGVSGGSGSSTPTRQPPRSTGGTGGGGTGGAPVSPPAPAPPAPRPTPQPPSRPPTPRPPSLPSLVNPLIHQLPPDQQQQVCGLLPSLCG